MKSVWHYSFFYTAVVCRWHTNGKNIAARYKKNCFVLNYKPLNRIYVCVCVKHMYEICIKTTIHDSSRHSFLRVLLYRNTCVSCLFPLPFLFHSNSSFELICLELSNVFVAVCHMIPFPIMKLPSSDAFINNTIRKYEHTKNQNTQSDHVHFTLYRKQCNAS